MTRYFFDTSDNGTLSRDREGCELADLRAAKKMAAASLAELARDVLPCAVERHLAVTVRQGEGHVVVNAELIFKANILAS